jgi:hypothetical protein
MQKITEALSLRVAHIGLKKLTRYLLHASRRLASLHK